MGMTMAGIMKSVLSRAYIRVRLVVGMTLQVSLKGNITTGVSETAVGTTQQTPTSHVHTMMMGWRLWRKVLMGLLVCAKTRVM